MTGFQQHSTFILLGKRSGKMVFTEEFWIEVVSLFIDPVVDAMRDPRHMVWVEVVDVPVGVGGELALDTLVPLLLPLHAATVGGLGEAQLIVSVGLARAPATTCCGGKQIGSQPLV